jgi:hypothetical protein
VSGGAFRPAGVKGQKLGGKGNILKRKIRFSAYNKLLLTEWNVRNLGQ